MSPRDSFIKTRSLGVRMAQELLQQIAKDVRTIKQELASLKEEVSDLRDLDLEVRPEYAQKLRRIDAGPAKSFSSVDELRKEIESD